MQSLTTRWFAPEDAPEGVEFQIRPLTMLEASDYRRVTAKHGDASPQAYEKLFGFGLAAWRGIDGEDGKPAPCTPKKAMQLPNRMMDLVALEIFADSFMTENQKKKLLSQSKSTATAATSTAPTANGAGIATTATRRRSRNGPSKTSAS